MAPANRRADAVRSLIKAEELLVARDLMGSRRHALEALDSDPLLDGVDQVVAVADVLLAADKRVNNHHDWYAILKLENATSAVDLDAIKKKYRKLALLLNPDKNKSAGAAAAFKLVLDAWSVLSDSTKRSLYDQERDIALRIESDNRDSSATASATPPPPVESFWTGCPYCYHLYEYDRVYENRNLRCEKCGKTFKATAVKSLPPIVPGMDAYYFNWGFFPMGFPGFGFNRPNPNPNPNPNPYMEMGFGWPGMGPNGAPFYPMHPPGSQQGGFPNAPWSENHYPNPNGNGDPEVESGRTTKHPSFANPNLEQRAQSKAPTFNLNTFRYSPTRLEKVRKEFHDYESDGEGIEKPRRRKKKAAKRTKPPVGRKLAMSSKGDDGNGVSSGGDGEKLKSQNGGEDSSVVLENKKGSLQTSATEDITSNNVEPIGCPGEMLDTDITDILNTLPSFFDEKGDEVCEGVEINFGEFRF